MSKLAVITGASSGIGLSFANKFASEGYDLIIVSRSKDALQSIAKEISDKNKVKVSIIPTDLSLDGSADELWDKLKNVKVDVFVNNAGFGNSDDVVDANPQKLTSMIALNITALTRLSQLAAISMKERGTGSIVNLASVLSFFPTPHGAVYGATKAYVLSFSEALSEELKGTGVYVTALCPGPTRTNFAKQANMENLSIMNGNLPTGDDVAQYGYEAMLKHKVVAVHGLRTKINALVASRLVPRATMRQISARIQSGEQR
jgi:short-subunit dehydrogenase